MRRSNLLSVVVIACVFFSSSDSKALPWDNDRVKNLIVDRYGSLPISSTRFQETYQNCADFSGIWERETTDIGDPNSYPYDLHIEQVGCQAVFIDESGYNGFGHFIPGMTVTFLQDGVDSVTNTVSVWVSNVELTGTHILNFHFIRMFWQMHWNIRVDEHDTNLIRVELHESSFGTEEKRVTFEGYYRKKPAG